MTPAVQEGSTAPRADAPILTCNGLRKSFGSRTAVAEFSLSLARGETYALIGPPGAGKTTAIALLCGLLAPDAGTVRVDGLPVGVGQTAGKAAIGFVPQDLALYEDLSARENLALFGRLQGRSGATLSHRIEAVLDLLGLHGHAGDRVATYPVGLQRRTSLAVGLLHEPQVLLLDEPTAGVDPQSRSVILEILRRLPEAGTAVLTASQDAQEFEPVCDRIGLLHEGRLVTEGTRHELFARIGQAEQVRVGAVGRLERLALALSRRPQVLKVDADADGLTIICENGAALLPVLVAAAPAAGIELTRFEVREPDLAAVLLALNGRAPRD